MDAELAAEPSAVVGAGVPEASPSGGEGAWFFQCETPKIARMAAAKDATKGIFGNGTVFGSLGSNSRTALVSQ